MAKSDTQFDLHALSERLEALFASLRPNRFLGADIFGGDWPPSEELTWLRESSRARSVKNGDGLERFARGVRLGGERSHAAGAGPSLERLADQRRITVLERSFEIVADVRVGSFAACFSQSVSCASSIAASSRMSR